MKNKLESLREKIDKVDSGIFGLLKKRLDLVRQVGDYKKSNNIKPLDSKRWKKVLEAISKKSKKAGVSDSLTKKIWNLIHKEALKIEKSL